jgi:hypothetical protein
MPPPSKEASGNHKIRDLEIGLILGILGWVVISGVAVWCCARYRQRRRYYH